MGQVIRLTTVPTSSNSEVDEFKKLLNLALKGDQNESEAASKEMLEKFRVRVIRPPQVRSFPNN